MGRARVAPVVQRYADLRAASAALAAHVADVARAAVRARGRFSIVLSGGATPVPMFELLATRFGRTVPWASTEVFFADERCVSTRSPYSNFASARRTLLGRIAIPRGQIHRIPAERPAPTAVREYGSTVGTVAPSAAPRFDLVLLGIGPDGHTASLFPGDRAVGERARPVVVVRHPGLAPFVPRISLTLPAIASSREVCFLVAGADKAEALARILSDRPRAPRLPAARVRSRGPVTWYVDRAAASRLARRIARPV